MEICPLTSLVSTVVSLSFDLQNHITLPFSACKGSYDLNVIYKLNS